MTTKKIKKENKKDGAPQESDADFLNRIMKLKDSATKKATEGISKYSKEAEELKERGKFVAKDLAEIEECEKIAEEFKKNPPTLTTKRIGGITVEYYYADKNEQKKIDLLKRHPFPFLSVVHSMSINPIAFSAYGNAYVKRGGRKVILPESSLDLPLIIRDGDIVGTENKSYVLDIKDEEQDEENNYWHIFLFPNSELKISVSEKISNSEPAYMEPDKVPSVIKKNSKSTVYTHKIEKVELLSGLFNLRIKKKGRDVNNIVKFAPGFPTVEFGEAGGLMSEVVKNEMEKVIAKTSGMAAGVLYAAKVAGALSELKSKSTKKSAEELNSFVELNKDGTVVIFGTSNRVALRGSGRMTKKIPTDPFNPVKITATSGGLFETDGKTNPDYRVSAIMKMWMGISGYIGALKTKNEYEYRQAGKSLSLENAKKMVEYAKSLGDKDMEAAAKIALSNKEQGEQVEKSIKELEADTEGRKREALEQLKFAEDSGEKELIEVAKAQVKAAEGGSQLFGVNFEDARGQAMEVNEKLLDKFRPMVEVGLPPYSSPVASDAV